MSPTRRGWSEADVLALPVVVDLPTAGDVLEIGRSRVYEMARTGELPTLRLGTRYKVSRRQLLEMLGIDASEAAPTRAAAADNTITQPAMPLNGHTHHAPLSPPSR